MIDGAIIFFVWLFPTAVVSYLVWRAVRARSDR